MPGRHTRRCTHGAQGAILGGAVADAVANWWSEHGGPVDSGLGSGGELTAPWGDGTESALATAESLLRGSAPPFDLSVEAAHICAIADHQRRPTPLIVDPTAADGYDAVARGLELPDHATTAVGEAWCFATELARAWEAGGADAVRRAGVVVGVACGASAIPSRWLTHVHGPGPGRVWRLRDLVRLGERLLGIEVAFPPDPPRRIGPVEVAPGVFGGNIFTLKAFLRSHPDGAVVSLHPIGDRLDDHEPRRMFLVEDVAARAANPHLGVVVDEILDTIEAFRAEDRPVFVHCHHGVSRTGLVLRAWLMRTEGLDEEQATMEVSARYPWLSLANQRFTAELRSRQPARD